MANGSSPRTKLLAADVAVYNKYAPFSALNPVRVNAPLGGNVYGVNKPDHYTRAAMFRITCDGVNTQWDSTEFSVLSQAHYTNTLTNANILRVNAVVNSSTLLTRKASNATLVGGDYKTSLSGSIMRFNAEKSGGGAFGVGTTIDVYLLALEDIATQAVTSGLEAEIKCYDFMIADENTVISAL